MSGLLLFFDYEIVFTSLEHDCIIETLKHFNIGDNFIQWIKTIYSNTGINIKNNVHIAAAQNCIINNYRIYHQKGHQLKANGLEYFHNRHQL